MLYTLFELGWDPFYQQAFEVLSNPDLIPARIISQHKNSFRVLTEKGEFEAVISGKLFFSGQSATYPAVGDWVAVRPPAGGDIAPIEELLPRKSQFSRLAAGGNGRRGGGITAQQIVAANIDRIFIVSAMDNGRGFNLRRLERYLTLSWNSGASPVLVLNKADLCPDIDAVLLEVEAIAQGVPILPVSALQKQGLDLVRGQIGPGLTAAFIGPSGVGKSSIINSLLGSETLKVNLVRESDAAGHHTTTHRELFVLPGGGAVIDTPGMRELQLWSDEESLDDTFPEIQALADQCRFTNCSHDSEPDCAVRQALEDGSLDQDRFNSYLKLQKELHYLDARQNGRVRIEEKARWRKISLLQKQLKNKR
jgi:ribosome biogenesis GTPase